MKTLDEKKAGNNIAIWEAIEFFRENNPSAFEEFPKHEFPHLYGE